MREQSKESRGPVGSKPLRFELQRSMRSVSWRCWFSIARCACCNLSRCVHSIENGCKTD
jgi:hypothetical protein